MIIMPRSDIPNVVNEGKEYYDDYGNSYKDIVSRLSINPENKVARLEKIAVMNEDPLFEDSIYKECAIGPIIKTPNNKKDIIYFDNYTYTIIDKKSGQYIQSGGYCPYPYYPAGKIYNDVDTNGGAYDLSFVCYGENNQLEPESVSLDNHYYKKRINKSIENLKFNIDMIKSEICLYENQYQLPYADTIGFLNAFFSTWTFTYPLECYIAIDSYRKQYNIPKIKYMAGIDENAMKSIYITLVREVDAVCQYLFRVLDCERRKLILHVYLSPFGSTIKISDLQMEKEDTFNNYNSTQVQSVMKNVVSGGLKYIESESLGILEECNLNEPVKYALETCETLF